MHFGCENGMGEKADMGDADLVPRSVKRLFFQEDGKGVAGCELRTETWFNLTTAKGTKRHFLQFIFETSLS